MKTQVIYLISILSLCSFLSGLSVSKKLKLNTKEGNCNLKNNAGHIIYLVLEHGVYDRDYHFIGALLNELVINSYSSIVAECLEYEHEFEGEGIQKGIKCFKNEDSIFIDSDLNVKLLDGTILSSFSIEDCGSLNLKNKVIAAASLRWLS